jgi:hypothetical protein
VLCALILQRYPADSPFKSWEGEWYEGERHGSGQLSLRDGSVVSGLWQGDAWSGGSARIVYGNGSGVYEGSVIAETWQRHGRGVWRGSNGELYEGDWVCDQRCGHGQWNSAANGAMCDHFLQFHKYSFNCLRVFYVTMLFLCQMELLLDQRHHRLFSACSSAIH